MRLLKPFFIFILSFLAISSGFSQKISISLVSKLTELNESCSLVNNDNIQFKLDSLAKSDVSISVSLSGTAERGIDYATNIPETVLFSRGDSLKTFDLSVFNDSREEAQEQITIITTTPAGRKDTFNIKINDQIFRILTTQDTFTRCSNEPFTLPISLVNRGTISITPSDMGRVVGNVYTILPIRTGKVFINGQIDNCRQVDSIYVISQPIGVTLNTRDTSFLCFPDSIRLIATPNPGNATITWTLDNQTRVLSTNSIQVKPRISRSYIVTVTSGACIASDTTHVRIDSLRNTKINHFPVKDKYCQGDSIFFFSERHPKDLFPFIKPTWNPSNGFQTSKDTFNAVLKADKTTTYFRDTRNNACRHTDSIFIKVVEPTIPVGPVDTTVCPGTTIQINFKADGSEYKDFKWKEQDGLISCEKCPDPKIKVNGEQMYKVEAKKDGCDASTEIKTHVFQKPNVRVTTNLPPPIIAGSNPTFSLLGTAGFRAVTWRVDGTTVPNNALSTTINQIKQGRHTIDADVTDANGCMWSYNFIIDVICPAYSVQLARTPSGVVYEGTVITLVASGVPANATNIKWSRNGNNISGSSNTIQDKPTQQGTYTYRFEAVDPLTACPVSAQLNVTVIPCLSAEELKKKIPNAFSPNGDGKNDFFTYSDGAIKIEKIVVYSRWGQLVYNNTTPATGWDGKVNGTEAASDVYIYRMTYICGDGAPQEVSGTITLLR